MEIFYDPQGTPEWFQLRSGIPTASCFAEVIQKVGPRGGIPKGRQTYLWKLAGEILTGRFDSYVSWEMQRGKENEAEARDLYAMLLKVVPVQVGFIRNGVCGGSPDALIDNNGLLEIKDAAPHIQIARLLKGTFAAEHMPQCQGNLMCGEREWIDCMSHCQGMKPLIERIYRDEPYIAALRVDIEAFVDELNELVHRIRSM